MSDYFKATQFKSRIIAPLKTRAIYGAAVTAGYDDGMQVAFVAPTADEAVKAAQKGGCFGFKPEGAQDVVLLGASKFEELLRLAGIAEAP